MSMRVGTKSTLMMPMIGMLFALMIIPAFAEVETIQTDKLFYTLDDTIHFSGTVSEDATGLVTIVIRNSNDEFLMLNQAFINTDDTFEKDIKVINAKFLDQGIYKAIAFIKDLDKGTTTQFDFSPSGSAVIPSVTSVHPEIVPSQTPEENTDTKDVEDTTEQTSSEQNTVTPVIFTVPAFVDPLKDPQYYVDRYNNEPEYKAWFDTYYPNLTIEDAVGLSVQEEIVEPEPPKEESIETKFQPYVDKTKDPQYYVDRYNNEPEYKAWFDSNFPNDTIYAALGLSMPVITNSTTTEVTEEEPEMVTTDVKTSDDSNTNNEVSQLLLAIGGIGVLFGAVYGIKRKVDTNTEQIEANKTMLQKKVEKNSEQISQNRFWLKKKLNMLKPHSDPIDQIRDRLAKGEITVDEFRELLKALNDKNQ